MSQIQEYWLPGYGLSRSIVLGHLQYFLGPSASVRPYSMQVSQTFSVVSPLTDDIAGPGRLSHRWDATHKSQFP